MITRIILLGWAAWLITKVSLMMFGDPSLVSATSGAMYSALLTLVLGGVLAFFKWSASTDGEKNANTYDDTQE